MLDLATIFSSMARIRILRTLHRSRIPLPLRQIAYLSRLPLFSVQRALKQLCDEGILIRREKKPYVLFELKRNYPAYRFLEELFNLEAKHRIADQANRFSYKAPHVLDFASSGRTFIRQAKFPAQRVKTKEGQSVEDLILTKFFSLKKDPRRFNDLDDLKSIFEAKHDLDLAYLCGQMRRLSLVVPKELKAYAPKALYLVSKRRE